MLNSQSRPVMLQVRPGDMLLLMQLNAALWRPVERAATDKPTLKEIKR